MTLKDKFKLIADIITKKTSKDPIAIVTEIMHEDFISIHGPEHHFLDGAAFLVAYKNAGGEIDLPQALNELAARAITMPGAMCGFWGGMRFNRLTWGIFGYHQWNRTIIKRRVL